MYLSGVPGHKKLLPRPCPQCGQENGGCQIVIFNPRFYLKHTGYPRRHPYVILRISHYSKEQYHLASKKERSKRTKMWHTFRVSGIRRIQRGSKTVLLEDIFNGSYNTKQSITIPLDVESYDYFKTNGWSVVTDRAHWLKKGSLEKCEDCDRVFKHLLEFGYGRYSSWLCQSCYSIRAKLTEIKSNSKFHN